MDEFTVQDWDAFMLENPKLKDSYDLWLRIINTNPRLALEIYKEMLKLIDY